MTVYLLHTHLQSNVIKSSPSIVYIYLIKWKITHNYTEVLLKCLSNWKYSTMALMSKKEWKEEKIRIMHSPLNHSIFIFIIFESRYYLKK